MIWRRQARNDSIEENTGIVKWDAVILQWFGHGIEVGYCLAQRVNFQVRILTWNHLQNLHLFIWREELLHILITSKHTNGIILWYLIHNRLNGINNEWNLINSIFSSRTVPVDMEYHKYETYLLKKIAVRSLVVPENGDNVLHCLRKPRVSGFLKTMENSLGAQEDEFKEFIMLLGVQGIRGLHRRTCSITFSYPWTLAEGYLPRIHSDYQIILFYLFLIEIEENNLVKICSWH